MKKKLSVEEWFSISLATLYVVITFFVALGVDPSHRVMARNNMFAGLAQLFNIPIPAKSYSGLWILLIFYLVFILIAVILIVLTRKYFINRNHNPNSVRSIVYYSVIGFSSLAISTSLGIVFQLFEKSEDVGGIANLDETFGFVFGVLFLGQLIGSLVNLMRHQAIFDCVSKLSSSLSYYLQVCHLVVETDFKANHLLKIKKMLSEAYQQLKQLEIISNMIKQRSNLLAFLLLNGLLSWDYHCCCRLDNWLQTNVNMSKWLNQIGELESLISLQTLYQVKDDVTMPTLLDESKPILSFRELKHPLLLEKTAVANSFTMESQVAIITGSNMSGKTTFLRTVGINLVLSYAGGPVIAKDFSCSLMEIFTSMRIEDDIQGISTFYGELLRIKEMVKANQSQRIMIALIDEIFKGTNSADRIIGALETVKRLSSSNIFTLITTHDFELCEVPTIINYHFSETYLNEYRDIYFDYKIKEGKSQSTNAIFLLKRSGIIN